MFCESETRFQDKSLQQKFLGERVEYLNQVNASGGKLRVRSGADAVRSAKALVTKSKDEVKTTAPKKWAVPVTKWSSLYPVVVSS